MRIRTLLLFALVATLLGGAVAAQAPKPAVSIQVTIKDGVEVSRTDPTVPKVIRDLTGKLKKVPYAAI